MSGTETSKLQENSKSPIKWRKVLKYFLLFCLLGYLVSIFILNSSWVKHKITAKLAQKTPSEWEVGHITWVPFGNVVVHDVNSTMGEGGINLRSITVSPSWGRLLSGNLDFNEIVIQEGRLDLDLEWVKENIKTKPVESISKGSPRTESTTEPLKQPPAQNQSTPENKETRTTKTNAASDIQAPREQEIKEIPKVLGANKWLKVNDFKVSLKHGKETIDQIENIKLKVPYAGRTADGDISFIFRGKEMNQQVSWDGNFLKAENLNGKDFGISYQWLALLKVNQPGLPFSLNFRIPKQPLDMQINQPNLHWSALASDIHANLQLAGGLKSLNTWRGVFVANAKNITISEDQKTRKKEHFDHVRIVGNLNKGKLYVPTAEAVGHDVSLLSNGAIHSNLYSYGVLRIITHERANLFFNKVHRATKAINVGPRHMQFFERLDTPDRGYCDIYFDGPLNDLELRHNRSDRWQKVKPIIKKLINFKDLELREDGLLE